MDYPPPPYFPPSQPAPGDGSKATTSLVLGIVALVCCGLFTGIPAMVMGHAVNRERQAAGLPSDGNATAGFITGLIGTLWSGLAILLVVGVFALGGLASTVFKENCSSTSTDNGVEISCS